MLTNQLMRHLGLSNKNVGINTSYTGIADKIHNVLNQLESKTSFARFYMILQLLGSNEEMESRNIEVIDLLNTIISESENIVNEIENKSRVEVSWLIIDIKDIMNKNKELLECNLDIKIGLEKLIDQIVGKRSLL